ncbi:lactate utilization protein [Candidatus Babeliales bacterium]|nr:lactate utilization protein [Candidatus Babeliales bacterium]
MNNATEKFWWMRMSDLKITLEANNFEVFLASNAEEAKKLVMEEIVPATGAKSISWGGSMTFIDTGLYDALKDCDGMEVLDTFDKSVPPEEFLERRRKALLTDLFFTGTNAVTEAGQLVNLDMIGNRVGAIAFGPKHVVIVVGRNKLVSDLEEAMIRIKDYASPANAIRLGMKTPCAKTSFCEECTSSSRVCNTWTITEKSFPKGRIKVVIINEDMGL